MYHSIIAFHAVLFIISAIIALIYHDTEYKDSTSIMVGITILTLLVNFIFIGYMFWVLFL